MTKRCMEDCCSHTFCSTCKVGEKEDVQEPDATPSSTTILGAAGSTGEAGSSGEEMDIGLTT